MSEPVIIATVSIVVTVNLGVLGYLIKRTITRSDEDRKSMQEEAKASREELVKALKAISDNNNEQHKEFYKTLEALGIRVNTLEVEHKINHPRC
jgi:predicted nucleic acid-binding OB-fold protein